MEAFDDDEFGELARQLRLDTLVRLRWLAAGGQAAAILVSHFGLGVGLPLAVCLACVGISMLLNLWLRLRFPVSLRLDDGFATRVLAFDVAQLSVLLFLTGGLANPFAMLLLAPVTTSAVSLPGRQTLWLLAMALLCATGLELWSLPLRAPSGAPLEMALLFRIGLWAAICVSAVFVSLYASRVAGEARQLASALAATELILARAQHLSQLDGLAAAAAHELGTPLATVALVVHELAAQPGMGLHALEDLLLVEEQVARCRMILGKLSSPTEMAVASFEEDGVGHLIEEIAAPHRLQDVEIDVEVLGRGPEPTLRRNPAILYGLTNLVENAVGFAAHKVRIEADWDEAELRIVVSDDGPGFPAQVIARLGEPYISDRAGARRSETERAGGGLGLGLFIAKALLERSGGRLSIRNAFPPARGARASVAWPLTDLDQGRRFVKPRQDAGSD